MIRKTALAVAALLLFGIAVTSPAAYAQISACGQTVSASGNYTVTTNLTTASSTPCITITASDVAIDLQGHMIAGTGSASSTGVGITDGGSACPPSCQQNVIIANGTVTGFEYGILLGSTEYLTIAEINLMQNGLYGLFVSQSYGVVTDSQANNNGGTGMHFSRNNVTVSNSSADNNGSYGMDFVGSNNTVNNSPANNNGGYGMFFGNPTGSNNTVNNSPANNNGDYGMFFGGSGNTVNNSPANGNGAGGGMYFSVGRGGPMVSGNNTVTDSQANGNKSPGIFFVNGSGDLLSGNTTNGNGTQGISVVCPSNLFGNTAQGNSGGNIVTSGTPACTRLDNKPGP